MQLKEQYTMANGQVTWFEIDVPDVERGRAFYGDVFGWAFDAMPGMDTYLMIRAGETQIGALQGSTEGAPSGRDVTLYVEVADLEAALERAKSGGGTVDQERMEVPGSQWIGLVRDPFGLSVGLVTNNAANA
jgi:predicted enzyme related to lactoylglutathione lyase